MLHIFGKYGSCGYSGWNFACCAQYSYSSNSVTSKMIFWTEPHIVVSYSVLQMLAFLATGKHPPKTDFFFKNEENKLVHFWVSYKHILFPQKYSQTHSYLFSSLLFVVFLLFVVEGVWTQADPKSHKLTIEFFWFVCVSGEILITHLILISFNTFYVSPAVSSEFK